LPFSVPFVFVFAGCFLGLPLGVVSWVASWGCLLGLPCLFLGFCLSFGLPSVAYFTCLLLMLLHVYLFLCILWFADYVFIDYVFNIIPTFTLVNSFIESKFNIFIFSRVNNLAGLFAPAGCLKLPFSSTWTTCMACLLPQVA